MLMHPNFDPVAFSVGPVSVHWYGIMYLLAFATAWGLALQRAKRPDSPLQAKQVEDLIVYGALGVVLGGRIGYVFFYNFETWLQDPLWLFRVWEGGMSFHGGLLGVVVANVLYCRRIGIQFPELMDFVAVIVAPGLGFGRLGNFIGQELWGRETDVAWGMVFQKDPEALVRHPSQLYQAFLEGIVLFAIVYWFARKPRPRLAISALFVMVYGICRFAVEFVREPDAHLQDLTFGWMTRGQILTIPMILIGLGVLIWAYTKTFGPVPVPNKPNKKTAAKKSTKSKKQETKIAKSEAPESKPLENTKEVLGSDEVSTEKEKSGSKTASKKTTKSKAPAKKKAAVKKASTKAKKPAAKKTASKAKKSKDS
ncbi:MAG: prolipoprotein diacylglyceryl transferase [Cellvibrionaceae bacterium]